MILYGENTVIGFVSKPRYKVCSSCSNFVSVNDTHEYCSVCGERFIDSCPQCKEPILYPLTRFCPSCGKRILRVTSTNHYHPSIDQ